MDKTTAGIIAGAAAALVIAGVLLLGEEASADRTDVWLTNSVKVYQVELFKLADGGCSVQAYASLTKSDGGISTEGSATVEVAGANRVTCLDILDTKAPALFKQDKGL